MAGRSHACSEHEMCSISSPSCRTITPSASTCQPCVTAGAVAALATYLVTGRKKHRRSEVEGSQKVTLSTF